MSILEKAASNLAVNYVLPIVSDIPGVKQVVGFRESGVKKGSIAALAQSYQKNVKAGSQFSKMQSEAQGVRHEEGQRLPSKAQGGKAQGGSQKSGQNPQAQGVRHVEGKPQHLQSKAQGGSQKTEKSGQNPQAQGVRHVEGKPQHLQSKAQGGSQKSGQKPQAQGAQKKPAASLSSKPNNGRKTALYSGGKGKSAKK